MMPACRTLLASPPPIPVDLEGQIGCHRVIIVRAAFIMLMILANVALIDTLSGKVGRRIIAA
jgi:hypothetical protein